MKFVVIRRDNIGDLVCTTPLIHALREKFPDASIYALVNSYNKPALKNNPDIDRIYAYTKTKHRSSGQSVLSVIWDRLKMLHELRRERIDYVIIAGAHFLPRGLKLARALRPRHIIGFTDNNNSKSLQIDTGIPYTLDTPLHEAEDIFRLLKPLGIGGKPGPMRIYPDKDLLDSIRKRFDTSRPVIGVHISARKTTNRWQEQKFVELIRKLHQENDHLQFALFWSPGDENNPHHPGDDQKAERIIRGLQGIPLQAMPTYRLEELISFMDICDTMICSDGGALHIAAALGKPIVCFFGKSDASRWYPWGVPHVLLQTETRNVADISVDQVYQAYLSLQDK